MNVYQQIPDRVLAEINAFVRTGREPGGFLKAVLSNNLVDAVAYADDENLRKLPLIVKYIYNCIPGAAWGDVSKIRAWELSGGAIGSVKHEDVFYDLSDLVDPLDDRQ